MAITWSSWRSGGGNKYRTGVDITFTPTTPTPSTASVSVTVRSYLQSEFGSNGGSDSWWLSSSEAISASNVGGWSWVTSAMQQLLIATRTETVALSYSGTKSYSATSRVKDLGSSSLDFSVTKSVTLPRRPAQAPSPPTSATMTRVSDTQHNISWVRPGNAGSDGTVWTHTHIQRFNEIDGIYSTVRRTTSTANTWSDTSTRANNRYQYRVRGENATGESAWVATERRSTTPGVPTGVKAVKLASGDIRVSWEAAHLWGDALFEIRDNGGAVVGTHPINSGDQWIHTSPDPAVTHQYQVRALTSAAEPPVLYGNWSTASNVVQLLTPPNAPTALSPNGVVRDFGFGSVALTWQHNSVDTTDQEAYELRYRVNGGSWTTVSATSANSIRALSMSGMTDPSTIEWQVRTKGQHPNFGNWSAVASFTVTTAPSATVIFPNDPVTTPSTTISWTYFHGGGQPQTAWQASIVDPLFGDSIFVRNGSGTTSSVTTTSVLRNGVTYKARVRVRNSAGLWSDFAEKTFTVSFPSPNPPLVQTECSDNGYVIVRAQADNSGTAPPTRSMSIERRNEAGQWIPLADNLGLDVEWYDATAATFGDTTFRVTSITTSGAVASTEVVAQCRNDCDIFISGGPDFSVVAKLRYGETRSVTTGRERTLHWFSGRTRPVETSGVAIPLQIDVTAKIPPPSMCAPGMSQPADLERLFGLPGPHMYRDSTGRRIYCSLSDLKIGQGYMPSVSFSLVEADGGTAAQQEAVSSYVTPMVVEVSPGEYTIVGGGTTDEAPPGEWTWQL